MQSEARFKPNLVHSLLQATGSIIAGLGLAAALGNIHWVPEQFRFDNYGWYMVAIGFAMGIPNLNAAIKRAKAAKENGANPGS